MYHIPCAVSNQIWIYLQKVTWRCAEHLKYLIIARILTELEERLAKQLQYVVSRYIY